MTNSRLVFVTTSNSLPLMAYGLWLMAYGLWLMAYGLSSQRLSGMSLI
ncbi:exported hypothetical protein [Vibrio crassostreae]|nr:exported hypothetical protein [Vibrio crassostreae]